MTLVFRCLVITPMFWPKVRAAKFYGELAYISDFMEAINAEFPPPLKVVLLTIAIKVRSISAGSLRGKKRGGGKHEYKRRNISNGLCLCNFHVEHIIQSALAWRVNATCQTRPSGSVCLCQTDQIPNQAIVIISMSVSLPPQISNIQPLHQSKVSTRY